MKKLLFLSFIILINACKTIDLEVKPLNATTRIDGSTQGITYSLPKKEYYLQVKVERLTKKPGAAYQDCLTKEITRLAKGNGITDSCEKIEIEKLIGASIITSSKISFSFISAKLYSQVIPDSTKQYFVKFRHAKKSFVEGKINFAFTESGLIKNSSNESENTGLNVGIKIGTAVIDAALNIAGLPGVLPFSSSFKTMNFMKEDISLKNLLKEKPKPVISLNCLPCSYLNDLLDIKTKKQSVLNCEICEKGDPKALLAQLTSEEKRITGLLVGTKQSDTLIYKIPLNNLLTNANMLHGITMPIFEVNENTGLIWGGIPAIASATNIVISGRISSLNMGQRYLGSVASVQSSTMATGLRYNIPNVCRLEIFDAADRLNLNLESIEIIPQLGKVAALSINNYNHKGSQSFTLDTETGALTQYSITTSAPDKTTFDPLTDQLGKLPDNISKLNKTQRETDNLKSKTDYLKALKDYNDQLKASTPQ